MTINAFSWLVAWVRALTALERATRMALIASTLPSRTFGTTDARPDSAAGCRVSIQWIGLSLGSPDPPIGSVDLHHMHPGFSESSAGSYEVTPPGRSRAFDAAHRADGSTQRQQPTRQACEESDPTGDATPILTGLWAAAPRWDWGDQ